MGEFKTRFKTKQAVKLTSEHQIMGLVLFIAIIVGTTFMLTIRIFKDIGFNREVIARRSNANAAYSSVIRNIGICRDTNNDGTYDSKELNACDPNTVSPEDVPNSLRHKIMHQTAVNADLESVGRESLSLCYAVDGSRIDYVEKQRSAGSEKEKLLYSALTKKCSAIRVVPEALPPKENTEALLSSLNKIMLLSSWQPEKISPDGDYVPLDVPGLGFMPLKFSVEANPDIVYSIIGNVEKSIRNIDINKATISYSRKGKIDFSANATAYFAEQETYQDHTVNVTPSSASGGKKTKKAKKKGDDKKK